MPEADVEARVVPLKNSGGGPLARIDLTQPLSGVHMKGFTLHHLIDAMAQTKTPVLDGWRASVPLQHRSTIERSAITAVSWMPAEFYFDGVGFLARTLYGDDPRHALRIGYQIAQVDIGAFFRFVLAMASPATILGLSGRFWRTYYDRGTLAVIASTSNSCEVELREWPLRDECSLYETVGALVAWMEASRARDVQITRFELVAPGHMVIHCIWR